jgi:orotate phosphoribosyltransferase
MKPYQREFIAFCLEHGALQFGSFVLKSKRTSPYFFNAGHFSDGQAYLRLATAYAETVIQNFQPSQYDILFGPAYKGITLATCTSMGLAERDLNISVCFNRKEAKDHGEGGVMIGASLAGKRALLIDDVITAGTTIREAVHIAQREGGSLAGIVIALDRQEIGLNSPLSAIQEVSKEFNLRVAPIISRDDLIEYLQDTPGLKQHVSAMLDYKAEYGIA